MYSLSGFQNVAYVMRHGRLSRLRWLRHLECEGVVDWGRRGKIW